MTMSGNHSYGREELDWQIAPMLAPMIDDFDDDSDYASGLESYPSSVLSSDYHYKYENGRRYFARRQVRYPLPNDDEERNRLDLMHHIWALILDGKLFKSPVNLTTDLEPLRVLDVATGTGIWAIDVADQFPRSQVIGTDIAPVNPHWMPSNIEFQLEDIEDEWAFPENTFDLIHVRGMAGFVNDWPRLLTQCLTALKPGGYIELHDFSANFSCEDGSLSDNSVLHQWVQLWEAGALRSGCQWLAIAPGFKSLVAAAGFVHAIENKFKVPVGKWPKDEKLREIGVCMQKHLVEGVEGITMDLFTRVLSWDKTQVDIFSDKIKREAMNPRVHCFMTGYIVYARKPSMSW